MHHPTAVLILVVAPRIAHAECDIGPYATDSLMAGPSSSEGLIAEARIALGAEHRHCDGGMDVRFGPVVTAIGSPRDDLAIAIGLELELEVHLSPGWAIGARLEASAGSDDVLQYLGGVRLRRDAFAVAIDAGTIDHFGAGGTNRVLLFGLSGTSRRHPFVLTGTSVLAVGLAGLVGAAIAMGSARTH